MSEWTKWILWIGLILLGTAGEVILQDTGECMELSLMDRVSCDADSINCLNTIVESVDNTDTCYCIEMDGLEFITDCDECNITFVCVKQYEATTSQVCNGSKLYGPDCNTSCNCAGDVQCYKNGTCPTGCADDFEPTSGGQCQGNIATTESTVTSDSISTTTSTNPTTPEPTNTPPPVTSITTTPMPDVPSDSVEDNPGGVTQASPPTTNSPLDAMLIPILGGVGGFLFLILIILLCVFCFRKKKTDRHPKHALTAPLNQEPSGFDEVGTYETDGPRKETSIREKRPESQESTGIVKPANGYERMLALPPESYSIAVKDLEEKVKKERETEEFPFKNEYDKIPEGQTAPWEFGMRKNVHRDKNRFGNIIAYDHSRAALVRRKDDASEYINANFVDGYNHEKAFIATQGPMPQTVADFWRMCWEHQVSIIVMVTNVVENGREKCAPYWPDFQKSMNVGELVVTSRDETIFADYIVRALMIKQGEEMRLLKQYQFTGWPDHGVPRQATPLLTLRRRVRSEMADKAGNAGPTIVHCSAGVGRSGTFIAIDYLMNQAEAEDKIDVFECVWKMRYNRVNMVQTWDQYNFIYDALLEAVTVGQTTIPCYRFGTTYPEWLTEDPVTKVSKLQQQLRILDVVKIKYTEQDYEAGRKPENRNKNRTESVLPVNYHMPYLQTRVDGRNEYINAVFVHGYFKRDAFLITQAPLPDTRVDLWRMMYDYDCRTIVCLQGYPQHDKETESEEVDEDTPPPWALGEGGMMTFGPFAVQTTRIHDSKTHESVRITDVTMKTKKDTRAIQIFSPKDFPSNDSDPLPHKTFIGLKEEVKKWQQRSKDKKIVVMCKYGVERCGLYCAMDYVIEMIEVERDVDVFQATRQVQTSRTSLIPNLEQFKYLYEIAEVYMEINGAYDNFN